jgi:hypothetical protein
MERYTRQNLKYIAGLDKMSLFIGAILIAIYVHPSIIIYWSWQFSLLMWSLGLRLKGYLWKYSFFTFAIKVFIFSFVIIYSNTFKFADWQRFKMMLSDARDVANYIVSHEEIQWTIVNDFLCVQCYRGAFTNVIFCR